MSNTFLQNTNELIGLELSNAVSILVNNGVKFKLTYYTSDKQKEFDKDIVIRCKYINEELELLVGKFLFTPKK